MSAVTDVPSHVLEYLRSEKTMTVATASRAGVPHAATMVFASDDLAIYLWSRPESVTAKNMDGNPVVAFTIGSYSDDWSQLKGIQGAGEAQVLLKPDDVRHAVEVFEKKFPELSRTNTANLSFYRILPTELNFIDNAADGGPSGATLGMPFHRDLVFSVFRDLPQQTAETVAGKLDTLQVPAGQVIVRQGAPADKFFIIVEGAVEVVHEEDGESRTVATLRGGQFFGEMAILRDAPRSATVQATEPTTLLTMHRDEFRGLVAQSLSTTQDLDQVVRQRLDELTVPSQ
jgi:uncharacterized protein YhbP (UPF0306 family)